MNVYPILLEEHQTQTRLKYLSELQIETEEEKPKG